VIAFSPVAIVSAIPQRYFFDGIEG
jgi:hypothetical protein